MQLRSWKLVAAAQLKARSHGGCIQAAVELGNTSVLSLLWAFYKSSSGLNGVWYSLSRTVSCTAHCSVALLMSLSLSAQNVLRYRTKVAANFWSGGFVVLWSAKCTTFCFFCSTTRCKATWCQCLEAFQNSSKICTKIKGSIISGPGHQINFRHCDHHTYLDIILRH